jgi:hypothetical protein
MNIHKSLNKIAAREHTFFVCQELYTLTIKLGQATIELAVLVSITECLVEMGGNGIFRSIKRT